MTGAARPAPAPWGRQENIARPSASLASSAAATNPTPQAVAANAHTGLRLDVASGYITEVAPSRAGRRPATHAVSLQPSGRKLANRPVPMTVKLKATMKP